LMGFGGYLAAQSCHSRRSADFSFRQILSRSATGPLCRQMCELRIVAFEICRPLSNDSARTQNRFFRNTWLSKNLLARRTRTDRMAKSPSDKFNTCRKLVCEDAFEAQLAAKMAIPLLGGALPKMTNHYSVGVFLRRALTRYLGLVLSRLLDKPENGRTGMTASIASRGDSQRRSS
jgi:hypothetical protein